MGVDCETKEIDAEPIIIQSNTFVSIRPIIEAVGGSLGWDGATKSVVVNLPPHSISLSIGKNIATVDGKQIQINENPEIAPIIINSRTMLPFRFIAENLEGEVSWDGAEKRIDILFPLQNEKIIERAMMGMT
ncbi:MAG: copper amine oxidase N-terminal domain-containing protein, partial [Caldisericia bacterium]|nr:copper amine oxidase N-terminal domain-containing protein [Caldisericia bacterium]